MHTVSAVTIWEDKLLIGLASPAAGSGATTSAVLSMLMTVAAASSVDGSPWVCRNKFIAFSISLVISSSCITNSKQISNKIKACKLKHAAYHDKWPLECIWRHSAITHCLLSLSCWRCCWPPYMQTNKQAYILKNIFLSSKQNWWQSLWNLLFIIMHSCVKLTLFLILFGHYCSCYKRLWMSSMDKVQR